MSQRERVVLIYSKELSGLREVFQKQAVWRLRRYVKARPGLWNYREGEKMDKEFAPFFDGSIKDYAIYAEVEGVVFQPEVIRGILSRKQQREVKKLGFEVIRFH